MAQGNETRIAWLDAHSAFFTFGENLGHPDCELPVPRDYPFKPTRQPVIVRHWDAPGSPRRDAFTTIASWRQSQRDFDFGGRPYTWSKHHQFAPFIDLPTVTGERFEMALKGADEADQAILRERGWGIADAVAISSDADVYRDYIASSRGEFSVAKDQYVRFRTGWFSDRSASYLAAGRPVVVQDSGFGRFLPTGEGLYAVTDLDDAADAVRSIIADPSRE